MQIISEYKTDRQGNDCWITDYICLYEKNKYPLTEREQTFISIIDELLRYLHDDAKKRELNKFD